MQIKLVAWSFLLTVLPAIGKDASHFWRARFLWDEPRLAVAKLQTVNFYFGGGSTRHSRDQHGKKAPLFTLFGIQDFQQAACTVNNLDPNNPLDQTLRALAATPSNNLFAHSLIAGRFKLVEAYCDIYYNYTKNLFLELSIPIRSFQLCTPLIEDLSPTDQTKPNAWDPTWIQFLKTRDLLFARRNIVLEPYQYTALGDISVELGWTKTWDTTQTFDFIDTMLKVGPLFPTGRQEAIDRPLEIPTGYNGYFGFCTTGDIAFGLFDWVTIDLHAQAIFFFDTIKELRISTNAQQPGTVSFNTLYTRAHQAPVWSTGISVRADHIAQGLSLAIAYSYEHQEPGRVHACTHYPTQKVISPFLIGFTQQIVHLELSYDFLGPTDRKGARFGLFYNHSLAGKQIFITHTTGALFGIDLCIDY